MKPEEQPSKLVYIDRRKFGLALSLGLWSLWQSTRAARAPRGQESAIPVCIFSKYLQWLDYPEMAEIAAELGFDGVDITVRPGGHVLPENATRDLPRAVRAVRDAGLEVPVVTTAITDPEDPMTEPVLKTAADLGVQYYRLGYLRYGENQSIRTALEQAQKKLAGMAQLNQKYGIRGNYQNHAGLGYFGASLWDLREVLEAIDSPYLGSQFDIRHAVVEGALSWPIDFRALAHRVQTAAAKDFRWTSEGKVEECPIGEGTVDFSGYLQLLRESGFAGPFLLHIEYPLEDEASQSSGSAADRGERLFRAMRRDLQQLRKLLKAAGFALSNRG